MPQSITQAEQLGELRKSFLPRRVPGLVLAGAAVFCVLMGLLEFILALNQYNAPAREVLSDSFRQDRIMISVILGAVFIVIALALLALYISHKKQRVDLHANGVIVTTWRGSTALTWDEIMEVRKQPIYGRSRTAVNWNYTLVEFDGRKTHFRGLDGVTTLGRAVERGVRMSGGAVEE
jgi:hypothetical protein